MAWSPKCVYLTYTLVVLHLVARWADTSEGSIKILTSARGAGAGQTHAFIDICGEWDRVETYVSICVCRKENCPASKSGSYPQFCD